MKPVRVDLLSLAAAVAFILPVSVGAATAGQPPRHSLADLSATVDHPLVPLTSVPTKVFVSEEIDKETGATIALRIEETVLSRVKEIAGVPVTVVLVDDYHNGELVKTTEDYFAQAPDGTVYYLGERVNDLQNGQVVGHEGEWLTEATGNPPGLFMPPAPRVGQTFKQEQIPGLAEAQSEVIAVGQTVTTAGGTFQSCILTEDRELLDGTLEQKSYCPGVGLVSEAFPGGHVELFEFETEPHYS
jgi:hypothetical protein